MEELQAELWASWHRYGAPSYGTHSVSTLAPGLLPRRLDSLTFGNGQSVTGEVEADVTVPALRTALCPSAGSRRRSGAPKPGGQGMGHSLLVLHGRSWRSLIRVTRCPQGE